MSIVALVCARARVYNLQHSLNVWEMSGEPFWKRSCLEGLVVSLHSPLWPSALKSKVRWLLKKKQPLSAIVWCSR